MEEKIKQLKELVKENYKAYAYYWTSERSEGNYDDCFSDGYECGLTTLAYEIGQILEMDLKKPEEPEDE